VAFDPYVCVVCEKMLIYGHRGEPRSIQEQVDENKYWWCYGCGKDFEELESCGAIVVLFDLEEEKIKDIVGDPTMLDIITGKHKNEI
jgi:DNA-directed RNA polymerase subunit RPC12/RpoP